jgi:chemotaxis protein CheD
MLIDRMVQAGARPDSLTARLAGGAAMFKDVLPAEGLMLGDRNVAAVKAALAESSIPVTAEDVGGTSGRSVYLDASDGSFVIRRVGTPDVRL